MEPVETNLAIEDVRRRRIEAEREFYLNPKHFIDYLRDFGACPDAKDEPHGDGARYLMDWKVREVAIDPETGKEQPLYYYKMLLWPRGSFKSHAFDAGLTSWLIAKTPNIRVLVGSETFKQASAFVGLSMDIISSPRYKEVFGDHTRGRWYHGREFWSSMRSLQGGQPRFNKEPTLRATGIEQVQTGMHWDLVVPDDIASPENTKTPEGLEMQRVWLGETLAQLDPGCMLLLIGTRHHHADVYGWILKDPTRRAMFEVSIKKWKDRATNKLFFPSRLSEAYVMGQKALLTPRQWSAYYEQEPASKDEKIFLPEYFHVIRDAEIPSRTWTYLLTDFAFSSLEKNDRTAFWIVSLDPNRTAYVRDFVVGRWKPSDSVRIALELWNRHVRYEMKGIAIEATAHEELLASLFEEIRKETFLSPKIIPITGRSQEIKNIRIEAVEPRFRTGRIYFAQSIKDDPRKWHPLIDEMTEWPFSEHDDVADAISDIDKCDREGRFLLQQPPMSWQPQQGYQHQPVLIDSRFNPAARYDPRNLAAALQRRGSSGDDLWQGAKPAMIGNDLWLGKGPKDDLFR